MLNLLLLLVIQLFHPVYRAEMVLSRYLVDGESIPGLSHCGLLTLFRLLCSGINIRFSGASFLTQVQYVGSLPRVTQAATWTVNVGLALSFVAILDFNGNSSGYSIRMGLKDRKGRR